MASAAEPDPGDDALLAAVAPPARAATKQRPRAAQTRQRLLDGALKVFLRDGYAAARVDDIVALLPATRATFYLHFANKREVMVALLEDMFGASAMVMNPPVNRPITLESVRAWFDDLVEYWREHRSLISVLDGAVAADREIAALVDGATRASIALLTAWIRDAGARPDPALHALLLHGEAQMFLQRAIVKGWPADLTSGLDALALRWFDALRPLEAR